MGDNGYTLTRAMNLNTMNLKTGELIAVASHGKPWSQHNRTVEVVGCDAVLHRCGPSPLFRLMHLQRM